MNTAYQAFTNWCHPVDAVGQAVSGKLPPTPSDIEGPFYLAGAPFIDSGLISPDSNLFVSGTVMTTNGDAVEAVLDIWQADAEGVYDEKGYGLRGKVKAVVSERGKSCYSFQTIMPGDYQIAETPPDFRCAHIHVKVTADGCKPLTTQLYFADDKYNATDHWFDKRRVIQHPNGTFDFVLEKV
jgi:protocatechuate 3,4-dioxygenase beta subunit